MDIKIRKSDEGDWAELYVNNALYWADHSIPDFVYVSLLRGLGAAVTDEVAEGDIMEGPCDRRDELESLGLDLLS